MVASICPSVHLSVPALTSEPFGMVISRSIQNDWAFKMVVVSTDCAIAVDHAFNSVFDMAKFPVKAVRLSSQLDMNSPFLSLTEHVLGNPLLT